MIGVILFSWIWLLCQVTSDSPSQEVTDPVSVIHFFNEKTLTYDIYCENTGPGLYTIELGFEYIYELKANTPYPLRKTIPPGRHLVMKLTQKNIDLRGSFKIQLNYRRGSLQYDIDDSLSYLIPLQQGQDVHSVCTDSMRQLYPLQKDTCFEVTGFYPASDTICAARRGIVTKIQSFIYGDSIESHDIGNFLDIQHPDGTFGRYEGIKTDSSVMVSIGQIVEAGEPIAIVQGLIDSFPTLFSFRVFYYHEKVPTDKISPLNTKMTTIPVSFFGLPERDSSFCTQITQVNHPRELILQEMNKREVKRWLRRNKVKRNEGK